ncbi:MAG: hypothetical protein JNM48_08110 [Rhodospirillales bacterium]|nr:hypothetical protein [Rhodospirillales bacterium]
MGIVRTLPVFALALLLAGCEGVAGGSEVNSVVTAAYPPKPDDCPIVIFRSGEPGGDYQVVGRLTARIEGPPTPSGDLYPVLPELKKRACRLGADALAGFAVRRSPQQPLALVSATAIRFAPPEGR